MPFFSAQVFEIQENGVFLKYQSFLNTMKQINSPFFKKYYLYILSGTFFLVWITFFDRSNLVNMFNMYKEYKSLAAEKEHFEKELIKIKSEEASVFSNQESIESFAREHYMMKKTGETVFVMVDEDDRPIKETDK
jgi:cell division protein DivIC